LARIFRLFVFFPPPFNLGVGYPLLRLFVFGSLLLDQPPRDFVTAGVVRVVTSLFKVVGGGWVLVYGCDYSSVIFLSRGGRRGGGALLY